MKLKELCRSVEQRTGKRCTPAMVNNYEKSGLIPPPPRTEGGTRIFSEIYVRRICRIIELKSRYLKLDAVKEVLGREETAETEVEETRDRGSHARGQKKAGSRKAEIVDAAVTSFSQKGYHDTKISDIAGRIGCGVGTIYNYFPSKKDLLLATVDRIIDLVLEQLSQINKAVSNPIDRIREKGLAFLRNYSQIKDIMFILEGEAVGEDADFSKKAGLLFSKYTGAISTDVEDAINTGLVRELDSKAVSYELFGMVLMIGYLLSQDESYTPEDLINTAGELVLYGSLTRD